MAAAFEITVADVTGTALLAILKQKKIFVTLTLQSCVLSITVMCAIYYYQRLGLSSGFFPRIIFLINFSRHVACALNLIRICSLLIIRDEK